MTTDRASAKAVAERTGLSLPTVWQILSGRDGRYATKTAERVRTAAAELGFRPNQAAQSLRSGRFGAVALLMGTLGYRSELPPGLVAGIHDALDVDDRHLVLSRLDDARIRKGTHLPKILRQRLVDGILVDFTMHVPGGLEPLLERLAIPTVWLNTRRDVDAVHPDDEGAGRSAAEAVLAAGHRRVLVATSHETPHYSWPDRRDGAVDVLRAAGAEVDVIEHHAGTDAWRERLRVRLRAADRPSAIIGYRPVTVAAAWQVAHELGLHVPDDLSLVSFGEIDAHYCDGPPLSVMPIPNAEQGRAAIALLDRRIAEPEAVHASVAVPFGPLVGETIVPARNP